MKFVTEVDMANKFEMLLNSKVGIKGFPYFNAVFRELNCKQGIPDFIAISGGNTGMLQGNMCDSEITSLDSYSLITSLLKPKAPRTLGYIINKTGLSNITVKKAIKDLSVRGVISETGKGSFVLSEKWDLPKVELWAFELKLKDWKRALFQSLQSKAFANRVMMVMPEEKENVIVKNIETFKNHQIGIMLFNADNLNYKILLRPTKINPTSKSHNIYAMGRISSEFNTLK